MDRENLLYHARNEMGTNDFAKAVLDGEAFQAVAHVGVSALLDQGWRLIPPARLEDDPGYLNYRGEPICSVNVDDLDLILRRLEQFRHGAAFDHKTVEAIGRVRGAFPATHSAPAPSGEWEYRIRQIVVKNGFEHAVREGNIIEAAHQAVRNLYDADMLIAPEQQPKAS